MNASTRTIKQLRAQTEADAETIRALGETLEKFRTQIARDDSKRIIANLEAANAEYKQIVAALRAKIQEASHALSLIPLD